MLGRGEAFIVTQPLLDGLQVTLDVAISLALTGVSYMDGKRSVGPSALQGVMQHIADFPTRSCWQSAAKIAVKTGRQTRTVESALRALAALGLIETTGPKTRRRHSIGPDQIARLKAMLDGTEPDKMSDSVLSEPDNSIPNCPVEPDNSTLNCPVEPDTASAITIEELEDNKQTELALVYSSKKRPEEKTVVVDLDLKCFGSEAADDSWEISTPDFWKKQEAAFDGVRKRLDEDCGVGAAKQCVAKARERGWPVSKCNRLIDRAIKENRDPSHLANWFLKEGSAPSDLAEGQVGLKPIPPVGNCLCDNRLSRLFRVALDKIKGGEWTEENYQSIANAIVREWNELRELEARNCTEDHQRIKQLRKLFPDERTRALMEASQCP